MEQTVFFFSHSFFSQQNKSTFVNQINEKTQKRAFPQIICGKKKKHELDKQMDFCFPSGVVRSRNGASAPSAVLTPQHPTHKSNQTVWFFLYMVSYFVVVVYVGFHNNRYWNTVFFPLPLLWSIVLYLFGKKILTKMTGWNGGRSMELDVFQAFSHSFFGGGLFALMWESILGLIEILIFFGLSKSGTNDSKVESLRENDFSEYQNNVPVHIFLLLYSYLISSLIEEMTKAFILQHCCKLYLPFSTHLSLPSHLMSFLLLGIGVGSGFGSIEAILYVCIYAGNASFLAQIWLLMVRLFVTIPFHSFLGVIWGMELSKREILGCYKKYSWIHMGWKPVFYHGTFNFLKVEYVLLISNVTYDIMGWNVLGAVITILLMSLFILITWKDINTNFTNMRRIQLQDREHEPDEDDDDKDKDIPHTTSHTVDLTPISNTHDITSTNTGEDRTHSAAE
ncbi:hypothetical protein RFI_07161 [Reticulomyxa filosa]|uniref:Uncharacterized protein n=1 Tax=Reticulomyxa filosa TaxID=46433 RepID=X6NVV8_RETFI|nr:hypothetical protein RFI_07161 [Reticulomyxa filosa]|eukprot:ETO29959.1 hypothetical protein RFI_07161 [Reticulomyxa filosa]